jgi:hypothetical protein
LDAANFNNLDELATVKGWFEGCPLEEVVYPGGIVIEFPVTRFRAKGATGGSGKEWWYEVTRVPVAPAAGEVKLLRDDSYKAFSGVIELPGTVKYNGAEYRVTSSEEGLFEGSGVKGVNLLGVPLASEYIHKDYLGSELESLTVNEDNAAIGAYAFAGCIKLKTLDKGYNLSLPAIGKGAFAGCPLENVGMYSGTGDYAFSHAVSANLNAGYGLGVWPSPLVFRPEVDGADEYGQRTVENTTLTTVTNLPRDPGENYVPAAYFYNFTALRSVNWTPRIALDAVGDSAFMHTQVGGSFTTAPALRTIGKHAFADAGIDTRKPGAPLKLQGSVTAIGEGAFADNEGLTRVDLRGVNANLSLAEAGSWFAGSGLELVIVGAQSLEVGAFSATSSLRKVAVVSETLPAIPNGALPSGDGVERSVYLDYGVLVGLADDPYSFEGYRREAAYALTTGGGAPDTAIAYRFGIENKEIAIPLRFRNNYLEEELEVPTPMIALPEELAEVFEVQIEGSVVRLVPKVVYWLTPVRGRFEVRVATGEITEGLRAEPLTVDIAVTPSAITVGLAWDATLLPATSRIRGTVYFDGVAIAPRAGFLTWHQDYANLRLAGEAGTFTALVSSALADYGRVWFTLPAAYGGVKSPELAFYTPESHLGKWPPTLVEGRIVVFQGQKQLATSSRLRLREGETMYLYARVATNIPGEYNQHQTLLSLKLKWECTSDLVTLEKTLDGTYAITPKAGSGGGGAGGKLRISVDADPTLPNLPSAVGLRSSGGGELRAAEGSAGLPVTSAEVSFVILKGSVVEEPGVEEEPVVEPEAEGEPEGEEPEGEVEPEAEEGEPEAEGEGGEPEAEEPEVVVEPEAEAEPEGEEEELVVEAVDSPPLRTIAVGGGGEASYSIYTLSGRAVSAPLKAGLYIVKGEGKVGKIVVR